MLSFLVQVGKVGGLNLRLSLLDLVLAKSDKCVSCCPLNRLVLRRPFNCVMKILVAIFVFSEEHHSNANWNANANEPLQNHSSSIGATSIYKFTPTNFALLSCPISIAKFYFKSRSQIELCLPAFAPGDHTKEPKFDQLKPEWTRLSLSLSC